ncbi:MAG: major facilitator superfamily protein [Phycisphaerales bacterium]|nr:major facilitator superfamily protein [Phycisphaerales bacterium]
MIASSVINESLESPPARFRRPPRAVSALRRSLGFITLGWVFGAVWFTATSGAPLTLFAQALHASPFEFGILTAIPFIASLASVPGSFLIDGTGKRRRIFLWGLYVQRVMWFPIALVPVWMLGRYGPAAAGEAMFVFLALTFIMHCGQGVGGPAWVSWMADVVPGRVCGKYFSRRRQWAMLTAIPAALFAGLFLDYQGLHGPTAVLHWCAIIFLCAAVFGIADITLFQFVPDVPREPQRPGLLLRSFAGPLRDRRFLLFAGLVGTLTFAIQLVGQFANLYLLDVVKVTNTGAQLMLLVAPMGAQLFVLPIWGIASDRMGKKPLLVLAALGSVPVALAWCFLTPGDQWLGYVLAAAGAALWTGVEVANFNFVLEFAGSSDRQGGTSYVAVNSVIINLAGCAGGLAAGGIAQCLKDWHWSPLAGFKPATFYDVLFVTSALLRVVAIVGFLPFLHEPRARSAGHALRFMVGASWESATTVIPRLMGRVRATGVVRIAHRSEGVAMPTRRAA